jgi:amidase
MKTIKDQVVYSFSKENQPVVHVNSGDTVVFETRDCFDNQIQHEEQGIDVLDWDHINPVTGPVYIEGAQPGDILQVKIDKIQLEEYGVLACVPDNGVLGRDVKQGQVKRVMIKDRMVHFNDHISFPCNPMIGVIGVAPAEGEIPCGEPGSHGGNMDNKTITEGAILYLPVYHEGALFALGDVHGAMGDGEIMVSGLEIPAKVTVTLSVLKGETIENPRLENDFFYYTIASHENIEEAIYMATSDMAKLLMRKLNMPFNEVGMLLSAAGNLQFCQVVDPKRTVRMEISKSILK